MEGKILYKEESYELVGCAYSVFNSLGYGHHERVYGKAYAVELQEKGFISKRELCCREFYKGVEVGKYFLDFVVKKDHHIVIELKVGREIHARYKKQVLQYLQATGVRLGIIILFSQQGVIFERIIM